jgi:hypothetical protein
MEENGVTAVADEHVPDLASLSEKDRAAYLKTGNLPTAAPSASTPDPKLAADATATADSQEHREDPPRRKSRSERTIDRQHAQIKSLEAELASLRQGTASPNVQRTESRVQASPNAPKLKSFTDRIGQAGGPANWEAAHEAYEDSLTTFHEERRKEAVQEAIKTERETLKRSETADAAKQTTESNAKEFAKRSETFRKTLKEDHFEEHFMDVYEAVNEVMAKRPDMGAIGDAIVESELGPELIQYFGENPDEFDKILAMPSARALREIGKLEVSDVVKAPPPKTTTAAKRIRSSVGGAGASSGDPIEDAIERNDVMAYIKAANGRDRKEAAERLR